MCVACIMKDIQEVVVDILQTRVCERTGGTEHQSDHETDCSDVRSDAGEEALCFDSQPQEDQTECWNVTTELGAERLA